MKSCRLCPVKLYVAAKRTILKNGALKNYFKGYTATTLHSEYKQTQEIKVSCSLFINCLVNLNDQVN